MRNTYFPFLPILLISFLTTLNSQTAVKLDLDKIDQYLSQAQKDWQVPSMTVGIVQNGELLFAKGYGEKEIGNGQTPNEQTLYAIASNSKAFTSALIAMLVQEGKINWDDKVQKYLPYFELYDPYISQMVTIEDLLCHRVGLGTFSGDIIWYNADLTAAEIIKRIKHIPQAYDFRNGYGYSNLMYITAGEVIRTVTGKSWGENVQERILDPLGMKRTTYSLSQLDPLGNQATPHAYQDGKNKAMHWTDWEEIAATGGLISCVEDLATWMKFNLQNGIWNGDTLLTPASRNRIWSVHNPFVVNHAKPDAFETNFSGYGLGWGLRDYHGHLRVSHTGGYDGMLTSFNLLPDLNAGVIVLTNGMHSPFGAVTYYLLDRLTNQPEKDWSQEYLDRQRRNTDTRIQQRHEGRIKNTQPSLSESDIFGTYHTPAYGNIMVKKEDSTLKIEFEHTPALSATLSHWHFDTWRLEWDHQHAWFSFGTVQFLKDNNQKVTGISFDVPNDDFWFEEINAKKVNKK